MAPKARRGRQPLAQVKREKVVVKKEPYTESAAASSTAASSSTSLIWARKHYVNQVRFLDKVVKPPWEVCFGALGTGIIGVRSKAVKKEKGAVGRMKVKKEPLAEDAAVATGSSASSSSQGVACPPLVKKELGDDEDADDSAPKRRTLPPDASVVLLINAPGVVQGRNHQFMGGFNDKLDTEDRSMHWNSQRSDKTSFVLDQIVSHRQAGGNVIVGVRPNSFSDFTKLGDVTSITDVDRARCLLENGDTVIIEQGGARVHKAIVASCIDAGLKAGIGLSAATYPLRESQRWRLCSCCYVTPSCKLRFGELSEDGIKAYKAGPGTKKIPLRFGKRKSDNGTSSDMMPRRRMRFKQERPEMVVKTEPLDPSVRVKLEPLEPQEPKLESAPAVDSLREASVEPQEAKSEIAGTADAPKIEAPLEATAESEESKAEPVGVDECSDSKCVGSAPVVPIEVAASPVKQEMKQEPVQVRRICVD